MRCCEMGLCEIRFCKIRWPVVWYRHSGGPISNSGPTRDQLGTILAIPRQSSSQWPYPTPTLNVNGFTRFRKVTFNISGVRTPRPDTGLKISVRHHCLGPIDRIEGALYDIFMYRSRLHNVTKLLSVRPLNQGW